MAFIPAKEATPNQFDEPQEADRHPLAYLHVRRKGAAKMDEDDPFAVYIKNWLQWHILECKANDACIDRKHPGRPPSCTCLCDCNLSESEMVSCLNYLWVYGIMSKDEQQSILVEWIKYGRHIGVYFSVGESLAR